MLTERLEGQSLRTIPLPAGNEGSVVALIGPEGGWAKEEVAQAEQSGCKVITLGTHILRAETAAIVTVGILQSRVGLLG